MTATRPLREVFDELAAGGAAGEPSAAGSPDEVLAGSGHGDLPESLVSEAIVSYAETAPAEVAEHLAPFVRAHGPVPLDDPAGSEPEAAQGLELIATAPAVEPVDEVELVEEPVEAAAAGPAADDPATGDDPFDLAFGEGGAAAVEPVAEDAGTPDAMLAAPEQPDLETGPEAGTPEPSDLFGMPQPAEPAGQEPPDDEIDLWGGGAAG